MYLRNILILKAIYVSNKLFNHHCLQQQHADINFESLFIDNIFSGVWNKVTHNANMSVQKSGLFQW